MYKKVFKIKIFGNFFYEIIFNGKKYYFYNFKVGLFFKFVDYLIFFNLCKNWIYNYELDIYILIKEIWMMI